MTATRTAAETLRAIAELLTEHPELPPPFITIHSHIPHKADLKWYLHINGGGDAVEQGEVAKRIIRTLGGKWDKEFGDDDATFDHSRDDLSLKVVVVREAVCTRRVVGTKTVTLPAVEASPERTVEREVVEWDCHPMLAEAAS